MMDTMMWGCIHKIFKKSPRSDHLGMYKQLVKIGNWIHQNDGPGRKSQQRQGYIESVTKELDKKIVPYTGGKIVIDRIVMGYMKSPEESYHMAYPVDEIEDEFIQDKQ